MRHRNSRRVLRSRFDDRFESHRAICACVTFRVRVAELLCGSTWPLRFAKYNNNERTTVRSLNEVRTAKLLFSLVREFRCSYILRPKVSNISRLISNFMYVSPNTNYASLSLKICTYKCSF